MENSMTEIGSVPVTNFPQQLQVCLSRSTSNLTGKDILESKEMGDSVIEAGSSQVANFPQLPQVCVL